MGYSLEWVASEVGVPPRRIRWWMERGLLPRIRRGDKYGYTLDFVDRALIVYEWLQLYPRGPIDNLRTILDPEPEEEDEAA